MGRQVPQQQRITHTLSSASSSPPAVASRMTGEDGQHSDGPEPSVPPPKKKRTRTLTTPHQAAVLHALLAKSRFPNTAMREEVGRSIGLSARKVQIWFQNQRQKARRPRSQGDAPLQKSPQFGAFPGGSEAPTFGSSLPFEPEYSPTTSTSHSIPGHPTSSRGYYSSEASSEGTESSSLLSGPGMPGTEPSSELTYGGQQVMPSRPSTAYEVTPHYRDSRHHSMRRSPSPGRFYRPAHDETQRFTHDPSRTLAPLVFPPVLPSRTNFPVPGPSTAPPPRPATATTYTAYSRGQSLSPIVNTFAYQHPESAPSTSATFPPPYAVQPQPQWSADSFESTLRSTSHTQSWAPRSMGSGGGSITPPASSEGPGIPPMRPRTEPHTMSAEPRPPQRSRSGRYDPIRATFIYSSPEQEKDDVGPQRKR
ncbi:hypothetical protein H0H93_000475 [Arthromyces matolae]|nr:hypothetical protein H0H93_000475 [Arthromyces matolae]